MQKDKLFTSKMFSDELKINFYQKDGKAKV